ncbi:hypothetical protein [Bradyrhizobium sp. 26S5]|uniref:hypothetical protein n=1 Tax=Bradyrhizobium sp. 26S5 TaxID=3139729 RepID=UPI0030D1AC0C
MNIGFPARDWISAKQMSLAPVPMLQRMCCRMPITELPDGASPHCKNISLYQKRNSVL